jgi:flagellar hook-basal body complex protein FliE
MTLPVQALTPALGEWAVPRASGGEWAVNGVADGTEQAKAAGATDPSGGFGSMLSDAIGHLQQTQDAAAQQAQALATGETQDVSSVVAAVQEASLSMQLAAQVRNKAVEAYSELFHTQI